MGLSIVLVGVSGDASPTIERYAGHGYDVHPVAFDEAASVDAGLLDVSRAIAGVRAGTGGGRVAVIGYGYGGRFAYLAITRLGADAAAAFAGVGIGAHLDEAPLAKKPLSLHFGDDDPGVPFEEVRAIKGALEGFATTEIYRYPGVGSNFALRGSAGFVAAAADQAERRVLAFLTSV